LPGLLAHELRWVIVRRLAGSDLRVGELAAASGQGANLVSYHLGKLRGAGLVTVHRGAADARDNYYALDLAALGQITPGPVVQTVAVIGYAAAGLGGGLLSAAIAFIGATLLNLPVG
jgi:DNA-binding transcriptional ArsR family regulator